MDLDVRGAAAPASARRAVGPPALRVARARALAPFRASTAAATVHAAGARADVGRCLKTGELSIWTPIWIVCSNDKDVETAVSVRGNVLVGVALTSLVELRYTCTVQYSILCI
jgi:hypothetical protein